MYDVHLFRFHTPHLHAATVHLSSHSLRHESGNNLNLSLSLSGPHRHVDLNDEGVSAVGSVATKLYSDLRSLTYGR